MTRSSLDWLHSPGWRGVFALAQARRSQGPTCGWCKSLSASVFRVKIAGFRLNRLMFYSKNTTELSYFFFKMGLFCGLASLHLILTLKTNVMSLKVSCSGWKLWSSAPKPIVRTQSVHFHDNRKLNHWLTSSYVLFLRFIRRDHLHACLAINNCFFDDYLPLKPTDCVKL